MALVLALLVTGGRLNAQTNLTATFNPTGPKIELKWTDQTTSETGFKIEVRESPNGPWKFLAFKNANVTTHTAGNPRGEYRAYRVRAESITGVLGMNSTWSNTAYGQPTLTLSKTPTCSDPLAVLTIKFRWSSVQAPADHYEIEYGYDSGFAPLATYTHMFGDGDRSSPLSVPLREVCNVKGRTSYLRAAAVCSGKRTACSAPVRIDWPGQCPCPTPAARATSSTEVVVSWSPVLCATTYRLDICDGGYAQWTKVVECPNVAVNIYNLWPSTRYRFRVVAKDAGGQELCTSTAVAETTRAAASSVSGNPVCNPIPDVCRQILVENAETADFFNWEPATLCTAQETGWTIRFHKTGYYWIWKEVNGTATVVREGCISNANAQAGMMWFDLTIPSGERVTAILSYNALSVPRLGTGGMDMTLMRQPAAGPSTERAYRDMVCPSW